MPNIKLIKLPRSRKVPSNITEEQKEISVLILRLRKAVNKSQATLAGVTGCLELVKSEVMKQWWGEDEEDE